MANRWREERYDEIRMGGIDRAKTVDGHINRIASWMEDLKRNLVLETMKRDQVLALQASLTRVPRTAASAAVPEGLDPNALVTMHEASALPGMVSLSTLKRRKSKGTLLAATEGVAHQYRICDLYKDEMQCSAKGPAGYGIRSQKVANDAMWVFTEVCGFAKDQQISVPQEPR